ncbi:hypothetical protein AYI69_g2436 [Smittium culicis]|uniref:Uncharacterized protein n=1 Tax=Smittium culicis TaxID=133412 RepID=A0A1R1YMF2_9FUNG|nr:hypothetical protein AYI69_g2436 [Smittium culicis]
MISKDTSPKSRVSSQLVEASLDFKGGWPVVKMGRFLGRPSGLIGDAESAAISAKNILPLVARSSASAPVAAALRMYSSTSDGKFNEREKAAEDMYIRKAEAEKIKALHDPEYSEEELLKVPHCSRCFIISLQADFLAQVHGVHPIQPPEHDVCQQPIAHHSHLTATSRRQRRHRCHNLCPAQRFLGAVCWLARIQRRTLGHAPAQPRRIRHYKHVRPAEYPHALLEICHKRRVDPRRVRLRQAVVLVEQHPRNTRRPQHAEIYTAQI